MGLSTMLLLVAVSTALLPLLSLGINPPGSLRDIEKSFVIGVVALGMGTAATSRFHHLGIFGFAHLVYLLVVVTIPVLLGGWYVLALIRRRRNRRIKLGASVAVLLALLGVWGTHIEPNWLETDRVALGARVAQPLIIGVLSDVQTPNVGKHEWNAVTELLEAEPDMVMVPGDLFQGNTEVITAAEPGFVELLQALVAKVEVVAVVSGDSDRPEQLQSIVAAAGALYIDNQTMDLQVAGQQIRLAGVSVWPSNERLDTLAGLGAPSDGFTILLSHRPDAVFELAPGSDVDLVVSGHTHGGQISLPFFGPPVTLSNVPRSLAAGGLGGVGNYAVYVSTGVGLERGAAPQVRFGVRPSVGVIEVVPG